MIFAYNAAAERMLGVPKAEVLNRPVPQTAALLPRAFFLSAESGQASGRDAHIVRFHHTDFSVSSAPIVRKGAVKGYFTMLQPFAEEELFDFDLDSQDSGFEIQRSGGSFYLSGASIDHLVASVNFGNEESLNYFHRTLRRMGVIDALRKAGAGEGDTVQIEDMQFDFVD